MELNDYADELLKLAENVKRLLNLITILEVRTKLIEDCFSEQSMQIKDIQKKQEEIFTALYRWDKTCHHNFSELERFVKDTQESFKGLRDIFESVGQRFGLEKKNE